MKRLLKKILVLGFILFSLTGLSAEGVVTASAYFKTISDYYATLNDYSVEYSLKLTGLKDSSGTLTYKNPNLVRMDYKKPEDQVVCFNGSNLVVYVPDNSIVLQQPAKTVASATAQGLSLMTRYYTVAYEKGQSAIPLDSNSNEMVVKFVLTRKSGAETFEHINLAVNPDTKLIRRIEAVTADGKKYIFDFSDYKLNQGIEDSFFVYSAPASANTLNNFLYAE